MAGLADGLPADALPNMARHFGIGVEYVIPGLATITGSVPNADTPAQKVENGIGQGTVTALRDVPGLGGKTDTAEFGDDPHSHGWFAGIAGGHGDIDSDHQFFWMTAEFADKPAPSHDTRAGDAAPMSPPSG